MTKEKQMISKNQGALPIHIRTINQKKKKKKPISTHLNHVKDNEVLLVYLLNLPWAEFFIKPSKI